MSTSYLPTILAWHNSDYATPSALAVAERFTDAESARLIGMHDTRVEVGVANAFNGLGDSTGSDEFGYSVAWLDLADHLEVSAYRDIPAGIDYWNVGAWIATHRDMSGCRYALAYWDANGSRSLVGYSTRADMLAAFRAIESEFLAWDDLAESEI
jgi:hypothetical protein